jgi:hypothetical protein
MLLDGQVENIAPPYWGRKWKIIITLEDGTVLNDDGSSTSTGLDVSNLRVTGSISDTLVSSYNPCEITIYNLNRETEKLILSQGKEIYIELGYNAPELYGNVYTGKIYQSKRGKANVTDYTLTLKALGSYDILSAGIVSLSAKRGVNYRDLLGVIAQSSNPPLEVGEVPEDWGEEKELSRGLSLVGKTKDVLDGIAESTNTIIRIDNNKINVIKLEATPTEAFELNYKTGLVGQPTQSREGVDFQCLINPKILLNSWVHINNAYINEASLEYGEMAVQKLDVDGLYRVVERQFQFDTRGNEWYLNGKAVSQAGGLPDFLIDNATKGI